MCIKTSVRSFLTFWHPPEALHLERCITIENLDEEIDPTNFLSRCGPETAQVPSRCGPETAQVLSMLGPETVQVLSRRAGLHLESL